MFRESDIVPKRPHRVNQPVPTFQALSRASRFDEGSAELESSRSNYVPERIPTTYDTRIDPTNRDADWAGLVSKENQKRHTNIHRSQQSGIIQTEQGIVSIDEKHQWSHKRRDSNVPLDADSTPLIAGTGALRVDQWKTNNQRMDEPTSRDQLTLDKRALPRRQISDPVQATSTRNNFFGEKLMDHPHTLSNSNAIDFRNKNNFGSGGSVGRNGSMLSNIGQSIVTRLPVPDSNSSRSNGQTAAPRPKTLVIENYKLESGSSGLGLGLKNCKCFLFRIRYRVTGFNHVKKFGLSIIDKSVSVIEIIIINFMTFAAFGRR
jgi:hypothetical protein